MTEPVDDIIAFGRLFAQWERDQVCCGTVTIPQCVVLQALRDGPTEVAPLARTAGSSPSAMTRLLDGLVGRGFVTRQRDPADRRRVQVTLTAEGRVEADRLRALTVCTLDLVMQKIPAEQREQVRQSLSLVRKALEEARSGAAEGLCKSSDGQN